MKKMLVILLIYFFICPKVMANENSIEKAIYKESQIANIANDDL